MDSLKLIDSKKFTLVLLIIVFASIYAMSDYDDRLTEAVKNRDLVRATKLIDKEAIAKKAAGIMLKDAISDGNYEIVKFLIDAGLNVSLVGDALKLAKDSENKHPNSKRILRLLENDPLIYTLPEPAVLKDIPDQKVLEKLR